MASTIDTPNRPDLSGVLAGLADREHPPFTQKQLSALTGIDQSALSRYQHGLRPHRRHARAIEKALG